jgi:hypothetical protein
MKYNEVAAVSGKPGLYKVVKPTRSGVILESLDEKKAKLIVGGNQRVSILSEISIYTMTEEGTIGLESVMKNVEKEFKGDLGIDQSADSDELKAFMKHVLPEFDEDKVYPSDIKKLINWYHIIKNNAPEMLEEGQEETSEEK